MDLSVFEWLVTPRDRFAQQVLKDSGSVLTEAEQLGWPVRFSLNISWWCFILNVWTLEGSLRQRKVSMIWVSCDKDIPAWNVWNPLKPCGCLWHERFKSHDLPTVHWTSDSLSRSAFVAQCAKLKGRGVEFALRVWKAGRAQIRHMLTFHGCPSTCSYLWRQDGSVKLRPFKSNLR